MIMMLPYASPSHETPWYQPFARLARPAQPHPTLPTQPLPPPLDPGRLAFAASSKSSSSSSSASTRRRPWVNRPSSRSGRATSPAAGTSSSPAWARGGGRVLNNVGGGLLIPLFLFLKEAKASPFDPHPLPLLLGAFLL